MHSTNEAVGTRARLDTQPCTVTRWRALHDPRGERVHTNWRAVFAALARPRPIGLVFDADEQRDVPDKRSLPGWSPATFAGDRRRQDRVESVGAIVLDYDGGVSLDAAASRWGRFYGFAHTSPRHLFEPGVERFRVAIPFDRVVTPAEYARLWTWADAYARGAGQTIDRATKDPSRLWYRPGVVAGAPFETRALDGEVFTVDVVLAEIESLRVARVRSLRPASRVAPTDDQDGADRYLTVALERACGEIALANDGERNFTLNRQAFSIAGVPGADLEHAREVLAEAAACVGLGEREIARTIDSAFRAGFARQRVIPARAWPIAGTR